MGTTSAIIDANHFSQVPFSFTWSLDAQELMPATKPVAVVIAERLINSLLFIVI
jgi:hypothetical protein